MPKHGWFREHLTLQLKLLVMVLAESIVVTLILLTSWAVAEVKERLFNPNQPQENRQRCVEQAPSPSTRRRVHRRR